MKKTAYFWEYKTTLICLKALKEKNASLKDMCYLKNLHKFRTRKQNSFQIKK